MTAIIVFILTYAFLKTKHKKELQNLSQNLQFLHSQIKEIKALVLERLEKEKEDKLLLKIEDILSKKLKKRR